MDNSYTSSMRQRVAECKTDLGMLHEILLERELSRFEYRAAERSLQVLVEACIGIAKHWSRQLGRTVPVDAYSAFQLLQQSGVISGESANWRKVIGMRNALVYDYLNIEPDLIKAVIHKGLYKELLAFTAQGLTALAKHGSNEI